MKQLKFNESTHANKSMEARKSKIIDDIVNDEDILKIRNKLNVTETEFNYYLGYFLSYYEDRKCCKSCRNIDECSKEIKGTVLKLVRNEEDGTIEREFTLCKKREEQIKVVGNYLMRDFNDEFLSASLETLDRRKDRVEYEKKIMQAYLGKLDKGLFVLGSSGSGKSYPLIALCNSFVKNDKKCVYVEVKNFIESLKNTFSLNKEDYIKLMDMAKTSDILVLDNLGEEKQSEWVRDEVISTIIDYRIKSNLMTFITSCYSLNELEVMYNVSKSNSEIGKIKTGKFIEKLKTCCPNIVNIG